ncbi:MAG: DUF305 domain-containing protein [Chloroflexi bacterium]|nr:DUF305 domain-containing protein [Chloroflexota bacterium]
MIITLVVMLAALAVSPAWADGPTDRTGRAEVRFLEGMIDHHQMALDMANDCLTKATTESLVTLCQNVIADQSREIEIMRGWLLVWYGIEYQPMSMLDMHHMTQSGGMMGGGMMQDGGMMGGGMMQDGGMMGGGMMQGGDTTQGGDPMQPGMQMGTATPVAPATGGEHDQHHPDAAAPAQAPASGAMPGGMMMDPPGMMGMMAWYHHHLTGVDYEIAWVEAMIDHHDDALFMSERIIGVTERPELDALAQGIIDKQTSEIEMMEGLLTELSAMTM